VSARSRGCRAARHRPMSPPSSEVTTPLTQGRSRICGSVICRVTRKLRHVRYHTAPQSLSWVGRPITFVGSSSRIRFGRTVQGRRHTAKPKQRAVPSRSPLAGGQLPTEFADHLRDVCDRPRSAGAPGTQRARRPARRQHVEAPRREAATGRRWRSGRSQRRSSRSTFQFRRLEHPGVSGGCGTQA
jgi:hypothetical protein